MEVYHKIQTVFKRDPETNYKTLLDGNYSLPEFEYLKDNKWVFTEKVDGTNTRIIFNDNNIMFKGKSDRAQLPEELKERLTERILPQFKKFEENFPDEVCFYGEGYGAKIQKGGKYRSDQDFVLFDVKIGKWWLQRKDVEDIANEFGLDVVPIIGTGTLLDMVKNVKFNSAWGDFIAEGIVARPLIELKCRNGNRIITKIKYNDFKE